MELNKPGWLVQMEGILESLNEGVIVVDDCDTIVYANQALAEMTGVEIANIVGRPRTKFYSGDDREFLQRQIQRSYQRGRNRFEFFLPHADGARIPVVIGARVVEDLEGREFTVLTFTDIREQKRAQESLREANEKLEARQREIDAELALATRVQQSLVPQSLRWGRFNVETHYQPVRDIGGDFGIVSPFGDGHLNLVVCDVTGHGIGSALLANRIYTETVRLLERRVAVDELLRRLNRFVHQQICVPGFFFTLALARADEHGRVVFAAAGHPPMFWLRANGHCEALGSRSAILGLLADAVSEKPLDEIQLAPGERLVFYTDGLTDLWNRSDEQLGVDGLQRIVCRHAAKPLAEMKAAILNEAVEWQHGPFPDDISLILAELL